MSHCLKWGLLPANEVGRIAQHVIKIEGRKEETERVGRGNFQLRKSILFFRYLKFPTQWFCELNNIQNYSYNGSCLQGESTFPR